MPFSAHRSAHPRNPASTLKIYRTLTIAFLALILGGNLSAQSTDAIPSPDPEGTSSVESEATRRLKEVLLEEAPAALFSDRLGDSKVDLFAQGSWKTSIGGYLAVDTVSGSSAVFPGFVQSPWTNNVELSISLWLQEQYFSEVNFSDGFAFNSFLLGYENPDENADGLRSVRIGNKDLGIGAYPGLPFKGQADSSPGARAKWKWRNSVFELVARMVNSTHYVERFEGGRAVGTTTTRIDRFIRNRFFVLPFTQLDGLNVWIENADGAMASDGHRYKLATVDDLLFVDKAAGRFGLASQSRGRVRVSFSKSASSFAQAFPTLDGLFSVRTPVFYDETAGSPFDTRVLQQLIDTFGWTGAEARTTASIDGFQTMLLSLPGTFSPYEDYSWYSIAEDSVPSSASLDSENESLRFSVYKDAVAILNDSTVLSGRYPFAESVSVDAGSVYLKTKVPNRLATEVPDISISTQGEATSKLMLSRPALEGSLTVFRNGSPDPGVKLGADGQTLDFTDEPRGDELIEVSYDALEREGGAQAVQAGVGFGTSLSDEVGFSAGLGVHWPIANEVTLNDEASARLSAGTELSVGKIDSGTGLVVTAKGSLNFPSTTSAVLLENYSGSFIELGFSPSVVAPSLFATSTALAEMKNDALHPALVAGDAHFLSESFLQNLGVLTRSSFLVPLFIDNTDSSGAFLPWNSISGVPSDLAENQAVGPYIAGPVDGDSISGNVVVVQLDQGSVTGTVWTSIEIRLSEDQSLMLASSGSLSLAIRTEGLSRPGDVFLQIGELAEDIDQDGVLRSGKSGDNGFGYLLPDGLHYARAMWPVVGREGSLPSEDRDENGMQAEERVSNTLGRYVGRFGPTNNQGWTIVSLSATDAEIKRLNQAKAIRILVVSESGSAPLKGRILIGATRISGSGFINVSEDQSNTSATVSVDHGKQILLENSFDDGLAVDAAAGMAHLSWNANGSDLVSFVQPFSSLSFEEFGSFFFYLYPQGSQTIRVSLEGQGSDDTNTIAFDLPLLSGGQWYKAYFDSSSGNVTVTGADDLVAGIVPISRQGNGLIFSRIRIEVIGSGSGSLLIDNMALSAAIPTLNARLTLQAGWAYTDTILAVDQFKVLGNIRTLHSLGISASRVLASGDFVSESLPTVDYTGSMGLTFVYIDILAGIRTEWQGETEFVEEYHKLAFPYGTDFPVKIFDNFSTRFGMNAETYLKDSAISIHAGDVMSAGGSVTVSQNRSKLSQSYNAVVSTNETETLSLKTAYDLAQTSLETIVREASYGDLLGSSYTRYLPADETTITNRNSAISALTRVKFPVLTVDLSIRMALDSVSGRPLPFSPSLDLRSSVVAGSEELGFVATLDYKRLTILQDSDDPVYYGDQLYKSGSELGSMESSYLSVPFYEIFGADGFSRFHDDSRGSDTATQVPGFRFQFVRNLDPAWSALLLPKSIGIAAGRLYEKKNSSSADTQALGLGFDWTAINLFGNRGSLPLSRVYASDEFSYSFHPQWWWGTETPFSWSYGVNLSGRLLGLAIGGTANEKPDERKAAMLGVVDLAPPATLGFSQDVAVSGYESGLPESTGSSKTELSFSWAADIEELKPEIFNKKLKSVAFFYNLERFSLSYRSPEATVKPMPNALSSILGEVQVDSGNLSNGWIAGLGHETYLILPGIGYGRVALDIGFYRNSESSLVLAVQAVIEARIVL